ncbi:hypothetical protein [Bifidobacterium myosotis]|uniref:Uncharacterized protein n=1 Tax=Bifidobacterium myosotis TaxID=1630166 RepID=A0A5M9ZFR8_9BIFI|nr:hypothetical protein [Bifidobacterium myosotis]KAA8825096.1 hypothetical protein EMO91_12775 [Bifidobacterium myosotis]
MGMVIESLDGMDVDKVACTPLVVDGGLNYALAEWGRPWRTDPARPVMAVIHGGPRLMLSDGRWTADGPDMDIRAARSDREAWGAYRAGGVRPVFTPMPPLRLARLTADRTLMDDIARDPDVGPELIRNPRTPDALLRRLWASGAVRAERLAAAPRPLPADLMDALWERACEPGATRAAMALRRALAARPETGDMRLAAMAARWRDRRLRDAIAHNPAASPAARAAAAAF